MKQLKYVALIGLALAVIAGITYSQSAPGVSQVPAAPPSAELSSYNASGQTANISATAFFTAGASNALGVPGSPGSSGKYRFTCYEVETATGTSSVLPSCGVGWTDQDTGTSETVAAVAATNSANTLGAFTQGQEIISVKAGSVVNVTTAGGTYAGMTYQIRAGLEYIGN